MNNIITTFQEEFEGFKEGQVLETLKPIYPKSDIPKEKRIITFGGITFSKPLALGKKSKAVLIKDKSVLSFFFREIKFGDLLLVKKVTNRLAYCTNLSIKDEIKNQFYKNEFVFISEIDLANGLVKKFTKKLPIEEKHDG